MNDNQIPLPPPVVNEPTQNNGNGPKIAIIALITFVVLVIVGYAVYLAVTKNGDTSTADNTTKEDTSAQSGSGVDAALALIKSKLDKTEYKGLTSVTPATTTYIIEDTGYSTATLGTGYTLTYSDTQHLVKSGSKTLVNKTFPSMAQIYSDVQATLVENGYTIDSANTYESFDRDGPSGGQQVAANNDSTICVVSPIVIESHGTAKLPDVYTISIACSTKSLHETDLALQKQLVETLLVNTNFEKSSLIVQPDKQVDNFISAKTYSRFSKIGNNQALFMKKDSSWKFVVYTGKSAPACSAVDKLGIPKTILSTCTDSSNKTREPKS